MGLIHQTYLSVDRGRCDSIAEPADGLDTSDPAVQAPVPAPRVIAEPADGLDTSDAQSRLILDGYSRSQSLLMGLRHQTTPRIPRGVRDFIAEPADGLETSDMVADPETFDVRLNRRAC